MARTAPSVSMTTTVRAFGDVIVLAELAQVNLDRLLGRLLHVHVDGGAGDQRADA
jgi:hypothetical protein